MEGLSVCQWPLNFITFYKEQDPDPHRSERSALESGDPDQSQRTGPDSQCLFTRNHQTHKFDIFINIKSSPVLFFTARGKEKLSVKTSD
jgi:hypothetical protein